MQAAPRVRSIRILFPTGKQKQYLKQHRFKAFNPTALAYLTHEVIKFNVVYLQLIFVVQTATKAQMFFFFLFHFGFILKMLNA